VIRPDLTVTGWILAGVVVDRLLVRLEEALDARRRLRRWKELH